MIVHQYAPAPVVFPAPLHCLFKPKRHKILYGGRNAGRSWGCARALLIIGAKRQIRVLCARELQKSIAESVHKLLADQVYLLGLEGHYEVQNEKIIGKNGTTFAFEGIKNNTSKIRSYEGVDYCWVEEAVKVSKASWNVLLPTIRKKGSEVWATFNPELKEDYTYVHFVLDKDLQDQSALIDGEEVKWRESADSIVIKMTWQDNPWFGETEGPKEMEKAKRDDWDEYLNVWEGNCRENLEGAVYAKQLRRAQMEERICSVPYYKESPVDTFWDVGRADSTAIWFAQIVGMEYRILNYFEESGQDDVGYFLQVCQAKGYTFGTMWLPHDARAKRLGTKRSIEEQIRGSGYKVRIVPKLSLTDGMNAVKIIFPRCWFDEKNCTDGLHALRHYKYKVVEGQLSNEPLHDSASDGADAFRYLALAIRQPREKDGVISRLKKYARTRAKREAAPLGWMA